MKFQPIHKMTVVLVAALFALCSMGVQPAFAKGGGGGSSGGSAHVSVTPSPSARPPAPSPSNSGSGRGTKAPTNSGSGNTSHASDGRSTHAPARTGSNAPKSGATIHAASPKATTGKVTVSKTSRATGSNYTVGGHTYTYRTVTYYNTFHGGYPLYGTSAYWLLYNDPYYYPNYALLGDPWYGHQYPVGYSVQNGQFVQHHSSLAWLWILLIVLLVLAVGTAIIYGVIRHRSNGSYADRF